MSIFSIGMSGLNAAQVALKTTSNNISNVYTPGYNRELTLQAARPTGGTVVTGVERQFNFFIATQLNSATTDLAYLTRYESEIAQIDNLLADSEAGLAPLLQRFFSSLQQLSGAPSDPAARQGVIGAADTLSAQFRSLSGYLSEMQDGVAAQLNNEVTAINTLAAQVAKLNEEIATHSGRSGGVPNALLNERDHLVTVLSSHLDVQLQIQDGGNYNLTIGNGQPLVSGHRSYELVTLTSAADSSRVVVGYKDSAGNQRELSESAFRGGAVGGLLAFRSETLDRAQNQLGQLAVTLAMAYNAQHEAGVDLAGDAGKPMFSINSPVLFRNERNVGSAQLTAAFDPATAPQALTGSDYDLKVVDATTGTFEVTRRDSGARFTAVLDNGQLQFDGVVLTVAGGALEDGDRFQLQPTRRAAEAFTNQIHDPAEIAAAQSSAGGDNRNALALLDIQNQQVLGGRFTLTQGYMRLVNDVGNRAGVVQINAKSQQALTEQIEMMQQAESGVNLDEEAVNLIRYQQYYQANAKVIEAGGMMLDVILGLV